MPSTVRRKDPEALRRVLSGVEHLAERHVAVGFIRGTMHPTENVPVAELAAYHVFGFGVPVRDFMGQAQSGIRARTDALIRAAAKLTGEGREKEADALLEAAGAAAKEAIQAAIVDGVYEPLAEGTIRRREQQGRPSDKPLIDTGQMHALVSWAVRGKGE